MAEETYSAQASVNVSQAIKNLDDFRTAIARAGAAGELTDQQISAFDKTASRISGNLKQAGTAAGQEATQVQNSANAAKKAQGAHEDYIASLSRTRYALYDVSNAAGIFGAALLAGVGAVGKSSVDFQRDFANVQRTAGVTGQAAVDLKQNLVDLSNTNPISFSDITSIATLGGQLGIASNQLTGFSKTVAEFSATTNVSVDQSATALGRLSQLLPDAAGKYDQLASSILKTGVNSVATESQIISIAQNIAGIGASAGLTTPEVIGFSSALASIGVQPYNARGTLTRLFSDIGSAVTNGGQDLQKFAAISGETSAEFAKAWSSDPANAIVGLLKGVNNYAGGAQAGLEKLGITSSQDVPALTKLAQNTDVLQQALSDASTGFKDGSTLQSQYGVIADTLSAKLTVLKNNFQSLLAGIGTQTNSPFAGLVDGATKLLQAFQQIIQNPLGQYLVQFGLTAATVGGVVLVLFSGLLRLAATMAAVQTAAAQSTGRFGVLSEALSLVFGSANRASAGLSNFSKSAIAAGDAGSIAGRGAEIAGQGADVAATGTNRFRVALLGLGRATVVFAIIQGITELIFNYAGVMQSTASVFQGFVNVSLAGYRGLYNGAAAAFNGIGSLFNEFSSAISGLASEIGKLGGIFGGIGDVSSGVTGNIASAVGTVGKAFHQVGDNYSDLGKQVNNTSFAKSLQGAADGFTKYANSLQDSSKDALPSIGSLGSGIGDLGDASSDTTPDLGSLNNAIGDTGDKAQAAAQQVYTLVDYANDLQGVFSRSFDIRFGSSQGLDQVTSAWNDIKTAEQQAQTTIQGYRDQITQSTQDIKDQRTQIQQLNADISGLKSTRAQQQYFLSVAKSYKDTLRVQKVTADLADTNAQLASKQNDVSKANQAIGKDNSDIATTQAQLTQAIADNSKTLDGNSTAAINNRKTIEDLVTKYGSLLQAYAASGASQQQLAAYASQLKQQFIQQATQAGFSRVQIEAYARSFDDMKVAINNVPRNITVAANTNPALQALNEFVAKAKSSGASAGQNYANAFNGAAGALKVPGIDDSAAKKSARGIAIQAQMTALLSEYDDAVARGADNFATRYLNQLNSLNAKFQSGNYATGGFVPGSTPSNRGVDNSIGVLPGGGVVGLQGGEPIINNRARSFYGDTMFNAINSLRFPRFGYAAGGFVPNSAPAVNPSSGVQPVAIDAGQLQAILNGLYAGHNVMIDGRTITGVANAANQQYADLGRGR